MASAGGRAGERRYDVVIVGAGIAGMTAALHLAGRARVALLTKAGIEGSSSWRAQGGVAAALSEGDDASSHEADTHRAGVGLCRPEVVSRVVGEAPSVIDWLSRNGVQFNEGEGGIPDLAQEGGHSQRRVAHVGDATGEAIIGALWDRLREVEGVHVHSGFMAVDVLGGALSRGGDSRCRGLYALNLSKGCVELFEAPAVILATGGAARVYLYSTNPDGASGDGIAMAWRAGCRVANMEFMQFHPTCLHHPQAKSALISEAVRGEGGRLLTADGSRLMEGVDERLELAPRDIVARAIDHHLKKSGDDSVYLDISHRPADLIERRFPGLCQLCRRFGFDLARQPVPVVPAAHYSCGGVLTDAWGQTDLPGLFAIGEVACTGLHGANRLASNSLLECVVYGRACAQRIAGLLPEFEAVPPGPPWDESLVRDSDEEIVVAHNWQELRYLMWNYVGIVRSVKRLERARRRIALLLEEIDDYYGNFRLSGDLIELRNLARVAELTVRSASERRESRGLHFMLDHPETAAEAKETVIKNAEAASQAAGRNCRRLKFPREFWGLSRLNPGALLSGAPLAISPPTAPIPAAKRERLDSGPGRAGDRPYNFRYGRTNQGRRPVSRGCG